MTIALILASITIPLGFYAAVMWLTGDGGPVSIIRFWDDGQ